MGLWVFAGDREFFQEAMERQLLGAPDPYEITHGDRLIVYLIDEEVVLGPFEATGRMGTQRESAFDGTRPHQVDLRITDGIWRTSIEESYLKEELSEGGKVNKYDAEAILDALDSSEERCEMDITSQPDDDDTRSASGDAGRAADSLLDISKAEEDIVAVDADFSGEEHGRLRLERARLRGSDLSYTDLEGTVFTDADLREVDFTGANLKDADFSGAQLHRADFQGARLQEATLDGDLTECSFAGAVLDKADLRGATLEGAVLENVRMRQAKLQGTRPIGASFDGSDLKYIKTKEATFERASFRKAMLDDTTIAECDLRHADFEGASLRRSTLTEPNLEDVSFVRADLTEARLMDQEATGVDFTGANLSEARLEEVDLDDSRFAKARLNGTHLEGADLSGAVISDAKASDAHFEGANLERVSFNETELFGANLEGTALYGAIIQSARIGGDTRFHPDEDRYVVYDPRSGASIPHGTVPDPTPSEKAMSVYKSLEGVMESNAYGSIAAEYFVNRKKLARRVHRREDDYRSLAVNLLSYASCGYGESFKILFFWAGLVVGLLAGLYPSLGLSHSALGDLSYSNRGAMSLLYGLQFSLSAFTGLGYGQFTVDATGELLSTIETASGILFFALLVFVLTRRVGR